MQRHLQRYVRRYMRRSGAATVMALAAALFSGSGRAEAASYNVRLAPFSATGNGSTNDTAAIAAAIAAAAAAGGGEVYLPAGTYKITSTLAINSSITLRGEGQRTSILRWHGLANYGDGLVFVAQNTPPVQQTLTIRGLSLLRFDGIGGAAIRGDWPNYDPGAITFATRGGVTALIEDVHIGSDTWPNASVYWDRGILLRNATAAKVATFNIQGGGTNLGISGVELHGIPNGLGVPGRSVGAAIHDGTVNGFTRGVRAIDVATIINVQNLVIKNVQWGVEFHNVGLGTSVANNVIWAQHYGIQSYRSLGEMAIVNNRIHRQSEFAFIGIEMNNDLGPATFYRVIGNYVWASAGGGTRYGIALANMIQHSLIKSNTTVNMTTGIELANAAVTNTLIHGNRNRNAGTQINLAPGTNPYQANNW